MEPHHPPVQESLRVSCDRCRAKKLACVISTPEESRSAGQQCDRCIRARLECVFSRRAQTRKGNNGTRRTNKERTRSNTTSQRFEMQCDPQQPTEPGCALVSSGLLPGSSMDLTTLNPSWELMHGDGLPAMDDHVLHTYISSLSKDEEIFRQPHPLETHFDMSSLPLTAESSCRTPLWGHASSGFGDSSPDKRSSPSQFMSVSVLVTEIHEQTIILKGDPRIPSLSGVEESPDKYSVGPVLRLTRRLAAELRHLWRPKLSTQDIQQQPRPASSLSAPTYPVCPGSTDILSVPRDQQTPSELDSRSSFTETPDLATNLLMLTGYASLAKLYLTVLNQIHNVLQQTPQFASSSRHAQSHDSGEAEILQSGELSAAIGTFEACSRVYTTIQMLLDEFHAVEEIVSLPHLHDLDTLPFEKENNSLETPRQQQPRGADLDPHTGWLTGQIKMVRAGLKEDISRTLGNGSQGEWNSALQFGHYLKAVLRERMGL
ncbi:hypothetical protein BB8028_0006g06420 [Beauveria bassiana]|uniref:Zn(2)-C6 fungal-type domain-containing protein n=1 Tax=Beauveria bassiana TaxID=176275 RepID=A0A2S7YKD8_BEABA|nr:hypothetical protein BB8028_0006g06420 [Beauveria bassiana]